MGENDRDNERVYIGEIVREWGRNWKNWGRLMKIEVEFEELWQHGSFSKELEILKDVKRKWQKRGTWKRMVEILREWERILKV